MGSVLGPVAAEAAVGALAMGGVFFGVATGQWLVIGCCTVGSVPQAGLRRPVSSRWWWPWWAWPWSARSPVIWPGRESEGACWGRFMRR